MLYCYIHLLFNIKIGTTAPVTPEVTTTTLKVEPEVTTTTEKIEPGVTTTTEKVEPGVTTTTEKVEPGVTTTTEKVEPGVTTTEKVDIETTTTVLSVCDVRAELIFLVDEVYFKNDFFHQSLYLYLKNALKELAVGTEKAKVSNSTQ